MYLSLTSIRPTHHVRYAKVNEQLSKQENNFSWPLKANTQQHSNIRFSGVTENLRTAIENGNTTWAKVLMTTMGADINTADENGETFLTKAVRKGNLNQIRLLHGLKVDLNRSDGNGWSPFTYAVAKGRLDVIRLLYALGANLNGLDANGHIPLTVAIAKKQFDSLRVMLELGPDLDATDSQGQTALTYASARGELTAIELLNQFNAKLNSQDKQGWTPLTIAATRNQVEAIQLLYDLGADLKIPQAKGLMPLTCAKEKGHQEATQLIEHLLKKGNGNHQTPGKKLHLGKTFALESTEDEEGSLPVFPSVSHLNTPVSSEVGSADPKSILTLAPFRNILSEEMDNDFESEKIQTSSALVSQPNKLTAYEKYKNKRSNARWKVAQVGLILAGAATVGALAIFCPPAFAAIAGATTGGGTALFTGLKELFSLTSDLSDNPTFLPKFKAKVKTKSQNFSQKARKLTDSLKKNSRFKVHYGFLTKLDRTLEQFANKIQDQEYEECLQESLKFERQTLEMVREYLQELEQEPQQEEVFKVQQFLKKYNKYLSGLPEDLEKITQQDLMRMDHAIEQARRIDVPALVEWSRNPHNLANQLQEIQI